MEPATLNTILAKAMQVGTQSCPWSMEIDCHGTGKYPSRGGQQDSEMARSWSPHCCLHDYGTCRRQPVQAFKATDAAKKAPKLQTFTSINLFPPFVPCRPSRQLRRPRRRGSWCAASRCSPSRRCRVRSGLLVCSFVLLLCRGRQGRAPSAGPRCRVCSWLLSPAVCVQQRCWGEARISRIAEAHQRLCSPGTSTLYQAAVAPCVILVPDASCLASAWQASWQTAHPPTATSARSSLWRATQRVSKRCRSIAVPLID